LYYFLEICHYCWGWCSRIRSSPTTAQLWN